MNVRDIPISFYTFHKFNKDIVLYEFSDAFINEEDHLISFQGRHINKVGITITDS